MVWRCINSTGVRFFFFFFDKMLKGDLVNGDACIALLGN